MSKETKSGGSAARSVLANQLHQAIANSGVGAFVLDLAGSAWSFTPNVAALFGLSAETAPAAFEEWLRVVFVDDVPKIRHALDAAREADSFYVEFRVKSEAGPFHWLAAKAKAVTSAEGGRTLQGTITDINERKQLEARLLSTNEILETRVAELREEANALDILNRTGAAVAAELDSERLVQAVTDAGVELSGAQFGAFFYNVVDAAGESYTLYTLSGAPREAFERFPQPRNTEIFGPTFRGAGVVRSPDIRADPRYGKMAPYHGMPPGHLPVRSYLAVPVIARSGQVLGGLFFGHAQPGIFTARAERLLVGLAGQAAVALDTWSVTHNGNGRVLCFRWEERGRSQAAAPGKGGFGAQLITTSFPEARTHYGDAGFTWEVEVPLKGDNDPAAFAALRSAIEQHTMP